MKKLKTAVRVTELDGLSDTLVRNYKADSKVSEDSFVKSVMEELETLSAQITTAILQDKTLSKLEEADSARDDAVRALGTILSAYAVFPVAEKKVLSLPLKAIYDKYARAGITAANYTSESSMIESMLEDFASSSVATNIKGLEGVSEALEAIRSCQDAFTGANDEYMKANVNKGVSASSLKKPIVSLINEKLLTYLDAMVVAKNTNCTDFAKSVEAEIERVNEMISKRSTKKSDANVVVSK